MTIFEWLTIASTVGLVFLILTILVHLSAHTQLYEELAQMENDFDGVFDNSPGKSGT